MNYMIASCAVLLLTHIQIQLAQTVCFYIMYTLYILSPSVQSIQTMLFTFK